jgi:glycosyltransferase involved in cell wall biosynthesis
VTFLGAVDDEALREQYRGAQAVILPGVEDFGIVPVEAMACGRPVVALDAGGAAETVVPGVTGLLVRDGDATAFADALNLIGRIPFEAAAIRRHAETFHTDRFEAGFRRVVADTLAGAPC